MAMRTLSNANAAVNVSAVLAVPPPEERLRQIDPQGPASSLEIPQEYWAKVEEPKVMSEWRKDFDMKGFGKEMLALKQELLAQQNVEDDVNHLEGVLNWSIALYWGGIALCCVCNPLQGNILGALMVSTAVMARWTMVGHHVCHGGYNRQQQEGATITGRYHRKTFAVGVRRWLDWLDWMAPQAWDAEHNEMHHYMLGEEEDPDLVERNLVAMRTGQFGPMPFRYLATAFLMTAWKWYYYAPNTLKEMHAREKKMAERKGEPEVEQPFKTGTKPTTLLYPIEALFEKGRKGLADRFTPMALITKCLAPYFLVSFVAIPGAAYLALGPAVGALMFTNMIVAEVLTNIHSFVVIATNHVGPDIYRFATPVRPNSPEFYLRAVIGSTNFHVGARTNPDGSHKPSGVWGNVVDYLHGFLNYQIEHHAFPTLSMVSYQKAQPRVKAICEKYGVPYVQEPVWVRLRKTVDVMVGKSNMLQWESGI